MPKLIFCHVPKCAGATFFEILYNLYGKDNVWKDDNFNNPPMVDIIGGHFKSHKYDDIFPGTPKITFLRDPVERAISNYYFYRRSVFPTPYAPWVTDLRQGKMDILEYVKIEPNIISYYVSKEQIETFTFLGFVETWDKSILQFFSMFNHVPIQVPKENVNIERQADRYELDSAIRNKLKEILWEDYEVYNKALEIW